MNFDLDNVYEEALYEVLEKAKAKVNSVMSELALPDPRQWSELFDFESDFKNKSKTGVYCLVYKPTNKVAYYGVASKMNQRVRTHVKGFNADGFVDKTKESQVGKKMFDYDPDLRNWGVKFFETSSREVALVMEELCYWTHKSMFNNPSMLGK